MPGPLFEWVKRASWVELAIFSALIAFWLLPGFETATFVFGLAHGVMYLAMCAACLVALHRRIITLRIAVAVAVIGAIGPFVGSYEFARRRRERALG